MNANVFRIDRMKPQDFLQHLAKLAGNMSRRKIAEKCGLSPSTLIQQLAKLEEHGKPIPVETLVAICRGFNASILDALVAASYITEDEANRESTGTTHTLSEISDDELAAETLRRMHQGKASSVLTTPLDEVDTKVIPLHREVSTGGTEDSDDDLDLGQREAARTIDSPKLGDHTDQ